MATDIKNLTSKLKDRKKKQLAGFTNEPQFNEDRYYEKFGEYSRPRELFRRLPLRMLEKLPGNATKFEKKRMRKIEELLGVSAYA